MTNSTFINTRLLVTFIFFYKKITRVSSLHSKLQHLLRSITRVPLALRAIGAFCYAKCTRVSNLHSKLHCVAKIHFCVHFAVQNVYKCIFAQQLTTILFRKMCGNVWLQEIFLIIKKSK